MTRGSDQITEVNFVLYSLCVYFFSVIKLGLSNVGSEASNFESVLLKVNDVAWGWELTGIFFVGRDAIT